ncbi:aromatic amino acid lyase [Streptomyces sp. NPDC021608]|uniref:aromatic amino acid ammonia-lyase n=1 Tax=Streptomyces sp. NPDC021608 TaxID=3154903 RepID=UPI0033E55F2B
MDVTASAHGPTRVPPRREAARVLLDGATLTVGELLALADGDAVPAVVPAARERARRSWLTAQRLAASGRLYGRGTGVGAQRSVPVEEDDEAAHGLRLLRSHAGGAGALLPARQVRAMLAVRANQLLAGGSGIQPAFVDALADALRLGVHPAVNEYGGIGTGDLTALAQTGLTLIGERPWTRPEPAPVSGSGAVAPAPVTAPAHAVAAPVQFVVVPPGRSDGPRPEPLPDARARTAARDASAPAPAPGVAGSPAAAPDRAPRDAGAGAGTPVPVALRAGDALALLSSNALALGQAALAQGELDVLLRATHVVAALSLAAVSGSPEAYAAPVHALRPYPGAARAAGEVRRLLGPAEGPAARPGGRVQDPFGFRAFPQVHGCALDACGRLREVVEVEINCPSENPLLDADADAAYHHGGFFAAPLGLALDAAVLALLQTAQLSAARLAALGDPGLTGLPAFLATGPVSSSGTMILEYSAHSALAELRSSAAPASAGHAVLSRGLEEAASFAGQAARQALRATEAYAVVLACELVGAVRALRLHPDPPRVAAFAVAAQALPEETRDRPLTDDVTAAVGLLPVLAGL